jgi:RIO kinase 3
MLLFFSRKDAALAASLQEQESGSTPQMLEPTGADALCGGRAEDSAKPPSPSLQSGPEPDSDMLLAMALQEEYDREAQEERVSRQQKMNTNTFRKVTTCLTFDRPTVSNEPRIIMDDSYVHGDAATDEPDYHDYDDPFAGSGTHGHGHLRYDPDDEIADAVRSEAKRLGSSHLVNKHNRAVTGKQNLQRTDHLPCSFPAGDLRGGCRRSHSPGLGSSPIREIHLPNRVFSDIKRAAYKEERRRTKMGGGMHKTRSVAEKVLDEPTRLKLYKLVNNGVLEEVNGVVSMGKEAVVFHAFRRLDPEDSTSPREEVALKIFKTTVTEFTNRQTYLSGDHRFSTMGL